MNVLSVNLSLPWAKITRLFLGDAQLSLEQRILNFNTLVGIIFCLLALFSDRLIGLNLLTAVFIVPITLIFAILYYLCRQQRPHQGLLVVQIMSLFILMPMIWCVNDGTKGPVFAVSLTTIQYLTVIARPRWIALIFVLMLVTATGFIRIAHPEFIIPYPTEFAQASDTFFLLYLQV
ncbi:MAG: hypothetical protein RMK91_01815 [Pseudanabaenaceae cyanobacterium SKYGB_i_bin29]|nr:hypothetical protein [Pseudanabaenaceae cyanobacterium SKYG29]MDW8420585.1 hypothetical protein [Pseudanabaenaceae cyanobacterium SKYGB_i_bin29]